MFHLSYTILGDACACPFTTSPRRIKAKPLPAHHRSEPCLCKTSLCVAMPCRYLAVHRNSFARLCFTYQCHSLTIRCITFPRRFPSMRRFAASVLDFSATTLRSACTLLFSTLLSPHLTKRCVTFPMRVRSFPLLNFTIPVRYCALLFRNLAIEDQYISVANHFIS